MTIRAMKCAAQKYFDTFRLRFPHYLMQVENNNEKIMNTINPFNGFLKFNCTYCGQHMECAPRLAGRQFLCPSCRHPIVIPTPRGDLVGKELQAAHTWDEIVPLPDIEVPTRYRMRNPANGVLADAA
jgi:hypothetical protein